MQRAVSTYVYVKERLHPGLLDGLVRGGAQTLEIFAARQHLDYANRKQHVREIADWFRTSGITLNSVHAPLYADYEWGRTGAPPINIASTDRASRKALSSPGRDLPWRIREISESLTPEARANFCPFKARRTIRAWSLSLSSMSRPYAISPIRGIEDFQVRKKFPRVSGRHSRGGGDGPLGEGRSLTTKDSKVIVGR